MEHSIMRNLSVNGRIISLVSRRLATAATISGILMGATPLIASAHIGQKNAYSACTRGLLADGISIDDASSACASALEPRDISTCVSRIINGTEVSAFDALDSCVQVRRPREMASCVVQIDNTVDMASPLDVLENCTRSLLPDQYSDCVVGLDDATDLSAADLMDTCIAADYRLPSVLSNFEPTDSSAE
jgi:hypothetical protein